jgi:ribosomal protein L32
MELDTSTPSEEELVQLALDTLPRNNQRAHKLLQMWNGEELDLKYVHGHMITDDLTCVVSRCALSAPHIHLEGVNQQIDQGDIRDVKVDWINQVAYRTHCPARTETIEQHAPSYNECPICGHDETFSRNCSKCGMRLGP